MRQSSHSCLGLVFTLFDPPFNCSSSCCKDQFAVLYLIQTVKLVINVVILKLWRLCLHFNMHVLCLILVLRKVLSCYFMVSEHLCFFCLARFANRQINSLVKVENMVEISQPSAPLSLIFIHVIGYDALLVIKTFNFAEGGISNY